MADELDIPAAETAPVDPVVSLQDPPEFVPAAPERAGVPDELSDDVVIRELRKRGLVAMDPRYVQPQQAPQGRVSDDEEDDRLAELLYTDPKEYTRRIRAQAAEEARRTVGGTNSIAEAILAQVQAQAPDLNAKEMAQIRQMVMSPQNTPQGLQQMLQTGIVVTQAKGLMFDRLKKEGPKREANTPAPATAPASRGSSMPKDVSDDTDKMIAAFARKGITVKKEDVEGSRYLDKHRRQA